jgi:hypothetical protein
MRLNHRATSRHPHALDLIHGTTLAALRRAFRGVLQLGAALPRRTRVQCDVPSVMLFTVVASRGAQAPPPHHHPGSHGIHRVNYHFATRKKLKNR